MGKQLCLGIINQYSRSAGTYIQWALFGLIQGVDIGRFYRQLDAFIFPGFYIQKKQACCRTYPHTFVILFDDGGNGMQSVVEPYVFGLYVDSLQVIISSAPYITAWVFAYVTYVFIRTYTFMSIRSGCKISCFRRAFIYLIKSREISACPNNAGRYFT